MCEVGETARHGRDTKFKRDEGQQVRGSRVRGRERRGHGKGGRERDGKRFLPVQIQCTMHSSASSLSCFSVANMVMSSATVSATERKCLSAAEASLAPYNITPTGGAMPLASWQPEKNHIEFGRCSVYSVVSVDVFVCLRVRCLSVCLCLYVSAR